MRRARRTPWKYSIESAPSILAQVRITATLVDALESASKQRIASLGQRISYRELQSEKLTAQQRLLLLRQLRMITALVGARVTAEQRQLAEVAKYFRAMVAIKQGELRAR